MKEWPFIDPDVRAVGMSYLRRLTATKLRDFHGALIIQDGDEPLAVLLRYDTYQAMQSAVAEEGPHS